MEPEMPLMRVDVGVSRGALVPSNQVSLLNMCRLAPESKTQRDKVELSVGNLIAFICVCLSSSLSSLRTSQSCFVGVSSRCSYSSSYTILYIYHTLHHIVFLVIMFGGLGYKRRWILPRKFDASRTATRPGVSCDRIPAIIGISGPDR